MKRAPTIPIKRRLGTYKTVSVNPGRLICLRRWVAGPDEVLAAVARPMRWLASGFLDSVRDGELLDWSQTAVSSSHIRVKGG